MFNRFNNLSFIHFCLVLFFLLNISSVSADFSDYNKAINLYPDLRNGERIYNFCAGCHYEDNVERAKIISPVNAPGFIPKIAGQHKNVIIKQLSDIRSGLRDDPVMFPYSMEEYLADAQAIADVSGYIATLPFSEDTQIGSGQDLALGKDLYRTNCKMCHGENGEGNNEKFFPRIQGQHYNYLLKQIVWIRNGKRRNANMQMKRQIQNFTFREMTAVADYVSRLNAYGNDR